MIFQPTNNTPHAEPAPERKEGMNTASCSPPDAISRTGLLETECIGSSLFPAEKEASTNFAQEILKLAESIEMEEQRIKLELLRALKLGEIDRVGDMLTRWLNGPVNEVLRDN